MYSFRRFLVENNIENAKEHIVSVIQAHDKTSRHTHPLIPAVIHHDKPMFTKIVNHGEGKHFDSDLHHFAHGVVHELTKADPSRDKKHLHQIVNWYSKGNFRHEDIPAVHDTLHHFSKPENASKLPAIPHPKTGQMMKGSRLKSYEHMSFPAFREHVNKHLNLNQVHEKPFEHPGAHLIHDKNGVKVHGLTTKEASMHTRNCFHNEWCTSHPKHNMFNDYSREGPLYHVQTPDNKHWQFWVHSNQPFQHEFSDHTNEKHDPKELAHKYPELKNVKAHFRDARVNGDYPLLHPHEKEQKAAESLHKLKTNFARAYSSHVTGIHISHILHHGNSRHVKELHELNREHQLLMPKDYHLHLSMRMEKEHGVTPEDDIPPAKEKFRHGSDYAAARSKHARERHDYYHDASLSGYQKPFHNWAHEKHQHFAKEVKRASDDMRKETRKYMVYKHREKYE